MHSGIGSWASQAWRKAASEAKIDVGVTVGVPCMSSVLAWFVLALTMSQLRAAEKAEGGTAQVRQEHNVHLKRQPATPWTFHATSKQRRGGLVGADTSLRQVEGVYGQTHKRKKADGSAAQPFGRAGDGCGLGGLEQGRPLQRVRRSGHG